MVIHVLEAIAFTLWNIFSEDDAMNWKKQHLISKNMSVSIKAIQTGSHQDTLQ